MGDLTPQGWSATKSGKAGLDRDWVSSFKDKELKRLVHEAVALNPDMRVAAERVYQAQRRAYVAGADGRPSVVAEVQGDRSKRQFVGLPFGGATTQNGHYADLRVQWELDLWGRIRMGQSAALAEAESSGFDQQASEVALAGQVCKAWFALCEGNEQLAMAREVVRIRKSSVEAIEDRFASNLGGDGATASQLRLAQTDLASAGASVAQRESEVKLAQSRLEVLCGRYPSANIQGKAKLAKVPAPPPSGIPSDVLMRRPDLLSAERRFAAAMAREEEAQRAMFPMITLTGSTGTASDALEQLVNNSFSTWSLGAAVTQNIFQGGRIRGERDIRSSKYRESMAELESSVLKAFQEVENSLMLDYWLMRRMVSLDKASRLAVEAAKAADEEYIDGTGDLLTLLAAQSRAVELTSQVVSLKRIQLDNRVDLHLALGGEFKVKP
ncbi:efflux transporter outer membrane subunit [Rubritalea marina]|uniref:efflux transporter outer membrane subunit n=1 Tax=Rubritalea marina TaxID=361055 RepID=UPI00196A08B6|nr:efflux transporter outer membrane subunit [Rubritalea marina]